YGGGSGCGGVYIHEPGFPDEWNKAPFTCDWGRAGLFRHTVEPLGATFKEAAAPQKFIKVSRPTDADVDGMSAVYQAAWKGPATFNWAGPDQGYIVRVTPKGYTPEPLPEFEKMSDEALVKALDSPSHIRTLAAQRTLLGRADSIELTESLGKLSCNTDKALSARIAAIFTMSLRSPESGELMALVAGRTLPEIQPFLIRAYGEVTHPISVDDALDVFTKIPEGSNPREIVETIFALSKLNEKQVSPKAAVFISKYLSSTDPAWTIIVENNPRLALSPGNRTIFLRPMPDNFSKFRHLSGIALHPYEERSNLPSPRIFPLGEAQFPPALWPHDGILPLASLVRHQSE
ncbi:hypothetical protein N8620_02550, partial [Akkermansiaceae bacterium]|nr:hypothetical protein [Akkermansiaceae bacterium]